jgi:AICAR transformylase/IMP cyclohydrolase PurH
VTQRAPTEAERAALRFCLACGEARQVERDRVFAAADRTLGIGAGQMSRVDSTRVAVVESTECRSLARRFGACQRRAVPLPR